MKGAILAIVVLVLLSSCLPRESTGAGYAFVDVSVSPITDGSGLILMDVPTRDYAFYGEFRNRMSEDASDITFDVSNVNERIIDVSAIATTPIGNDGTLGGVVSSPGESYGFLEATVPVTAQKREYSTQLRYHFCADARTVFQDTVCIAPNTGPGNYESTCDPTVKTVTGGQGAPVAVVAVRQSDALDTVSLFIDVINYGNGLVFSADSDSCASITQEEAGIIRLEEVLIGGAPIACVQEQRMGYDVQYQKRTGTTFTCSFRKSDLPILLDSTTVLTDIVATFNYRYHIDAGTQSIIVRNVPGFSPP